MKNQTGKGQRREVNTEEIEKKEGENNYCYDYLTLYLLHKRIFFQSPSSIIIQVSKKDLQNIISVNK